MADQSEKCDFPQSSGSIPQLRGLAESSIRRDPVEFDERQRDSLSLFDEDLYRTARNNDCIDVRWLRGMALALPVGCALDHGYACCASRSVRNLSVRIE